MLNQMLRHVLMIITSDCKCSNVVETQNEMKKQKELPGDAESDELPEITKQKKDKICK